MNSFHCAIIVPVYFNQESIEPLYSSFQEKVFEKNKDLNFETIFVNDGSKDQSLDKLIALKKKHPDDNIKIIDLSRNFGQVSAIYAGYENTESKCVINISADMQDPSELMCDMLNEYFNNGTPIVIGNRASREEGVFRRFTSKIFYYLMRKMSFENMPRGGFDYVLLGSEVKNELLKTKDANPFWQGQILWTGFDIKLMPYHRLKRHSGDSKWTFSKKLTYLIDGVLGYSFLPLRLISLIGIIVALLGFCYALLILVLKVLGGIPIEGWAPTMIIILLLSGGQMIMLGVIGEYLWRNLSQTRNRSPYIIKKIYE